VTPHELQLARISNDLFNVALFAYIVAMVGYFAYLAFRRERVRLVAKVVLIGGASAHLLSIVERGIAAGRVPWGNMYEYSSLLAFLVVLGYLVIVEGVYGSRTLGGFALMFSILTMAVAVSFFYVGPGPLVPALNSYWIKIHVVAAILGSSLFALGGGILTIAYLVKDGRERREAATLSGQVPPPIMGGSIDLSDPPHFAPGSDDPVGMSTGGTGRRGILPPSAVLDKMAYRTIAFAFPSGRSR
jgi:ABC-type transport system involved in cytochrome c biogenesis permease subunit